MHRRLKCVSGCRFHLLAGVRYQRSYQSLYDAESTRIQLGKLFGSLTAGSSEIVGQQSLHKLLNFPRLELIRIEKLVQVLQKLFKIGFRYSVHENL